MVRFTQSLEAWMIKFHPEEFALIGFGHVELFTEEMQHEYIEWCKTPEGRSYLRGGSNYKEETECK